nr:hypothetical protein [Tanacetum cinerariifolium]
MGIRIPQFNVPSRVTDEAITKEMHDRLGRATTTASSLAAEHGSGNISKTQTKATPSRPSSPRTSLEGGPGCHFTIGDSPIQARPKRLSNLPYEPPLGEVKKLEEQLKHKGRRAVIDSSDVAEPSLDAEDSPTQGMMIEELDKDKNRERIQLSLDEELAQKLYGEELTKESARQEQEKYNLEKALELQKQLNERKEDKGDQAHDIDCSDPSVLRYHAHQNRPFSKAEVRKNMCYIFEESRRVQAELFQGIEIEKGVMRRFGFDLQQESSKKQKLDEQAEVQVDCDQEEDEMKKYIKIVPGEEIAIDTIPLATKPPVIIEWKII